MSRLVRWARGDRSGTVRRFHPRYWWVDHDLADAASVVTGEGGVIVTARATRTSSLIGLSWSTEDRWSHPLHRYELQPAWRGCRLRFRWVGSAQSRALNAATDYPTATMTTRSGAVYHVRLWNYRADPGSSEPRDQWIELPFDERLYAGHSLPLTPSQEVAQRVPVDELARIMITILPTGYDSGDDSPRSPPLDYSVELRSMTTPGRNRLLAVEARGEPAHALRMADGYDNAYHLTPEQVVESLWQLGYRHSYVLYLGISHFPVTSWQSGELKLDAGAADPLNAPARAWLEDLCARLQARGFANVWISVSFELLASIAPAAWGQRNAAGDPALSGWSPPSAFLSPANGDALAWLEAVALAALGVATAAGLAPRYQIGEPWWWDGAFSDHAPYIYDAAAEAAWVADTSQAVPTPRLTSVAALPAAQHLPYLAWCRDRLATATEQLRDAVQAEHPTALVALLVFPPQILAGLGEEGGGAPVSRLLNLPPAWAHPAYDRLQIEDYDWITAGRIELQARTWRCAREMLGYPADRIHYFAGFVLEPADTHLWEWIDEALRAMVARGPAAVFVWSREQVMRDGWLHDRRDWSGRGQLTTLATCCRIERRDGFVLRLTDHDQPLEVAGPLGGGAGEIVIASGWSEGDGTLHWSRLQPDGSQAESVLAPEDPEWLTLRCSPGDALRVVFDYRQPASAGPGDWNSVISLAQSGAVAALELRRLGNGSVQLYAEGAPDTGDGPGVLAASDPEALSPIPTGLTWRTIELELRLHPRAGWARLHVGGELKLSYSGRTSWAASQVARLQRYHDLDMPDAKGYDEITVWSDGRERYRPATAWVPTELAGASRLAGGHLEALGAISDDGISEAELAAGLYEGAAVRLFQVDWRAPDDSLFPLCSGDLGAVEQDGQRWQAELRGPAARLGLPVGEVYQPSDRRELTADRVGLDLAALRRSGQILAGSGTRWQSDLDDWPEGWGTLGLLTWTSGRLAGEVVQVLAWAADGSFELAEPPAWSPAPGDRFSVLPGYDGSLARWIELGGDPADFRGEPYLPGPDRVFRHAGRL